MMELVVALFRVLITIKSRVRLTTIAKIEKLSSSFVSVIVRRSYPSGHPSIFSLLGVMSPLILVLALASFFLLAEAFIPRLTVRTLDIARNANADNNIERELDLFFETAAEQGSEAVGEMYAVSCFFTLHS